MDWQLLFSWKLGHTAKTISYQRADLPSRRSNLVYGREVESRSFETVLIYIDKSAQVPAEIIKAVSRRIGLFLMESRLPSSKVYACFTGAGGSFISGAVEPFTLYNNRSLAFLNIFKYIEKIPVDPLPSVARAPDFLDRFFRPNALVVVIGRKDNLPADKFFKEYKGHVHILNVNGAEIDRYFILFNGLLQEQKDHKAEKKDDTPSLASKSIDISNK
jgi:hypothetical protein